MACDMQQRAACGDAQVMAHEEASERGSYPAGAEQQHSDFASNEAVVILGLRGQSLDLERYALWLHMFASLTVSRALECDHQEVAPALLSRLCRD